MKFSIPVFLIILNIFFTAPAAGQNSWVKLHDPYKLSSASTSTGDFFTVGTDIYNYISDTSFVQLFSCPPADDYKIASLGETLLLGTSGDNVSGRGMFISTDNGLTWSQKNTGLEFTDNISDFFVFPDGLIAANAYVQTSAGKFNRLFFSKNSGENWESIIDLKQYELVSAARLENDQYFFFCVNKNSGRQKIFKSDRSGSNFSLLADTNTFISKVIASKNKLFSTSGNLLYESQNGKVWKEIGMKGVAIQGNISILNKSEADTIFISDDNSLYYSTDNFSSWNLYCKKPESGNNELFSFSKRQGKYVLVINGSVYTSIPASEKWTMVYRGSQVRGAETNNQFFISTGSNVWKLQHERLISLNNLPIKNRIRISTANNLLFVTPDSGSVAEGKGAFVSYDNGTSWQRTGNGMGYDSLNISSFFSDCCGQILAAAAVDNNSFYRYYLSIDNASTWSFRNAFSKYELKNILIPSYGSPVWISSKGVLFEDFKGYFPRVLESGLAVTNRDSVFNAVNDKILLLQGNELIELKTSGLPLSFTPVSFLSHQGFLFLSLKGKGIYYSENNGKKWNPLETYLPASEFNYLFVTLDHHLISARPDGSIYITQLPALLSLGLPDFVRTDDNIYVYKDPDSDFAQLKYFLNTSSLVSVNLYNTNGMLVKEVIADVSRGSGENSEAIDISELHKGVYLLYIQTESTARTVKILVSE